MPPVLDPSKSKVDGLAFIGLSLAQNHSEQGHPDSYTHQTAFDLNEVLDRDYEFIFSTNDDGWLVGGGEPGPPRTYKLAAKDSAHVEVMRIGTYQKEWGGMTQEEIVEIMKSGEILIPQIEVLPTAVVANPDKPPELEIRFDMEPQIPDFENPDAPLPVNWQLRFIHNQLFKRCIFPSRFCPGAFHSTILRKAEFRSEEHREKYFAKCEAAIQRWREAGPQPLNTIKRDLEGKPLPVLHKEHHDEKDAEPKLQHADDESSTIPKDPVSDPVPERSFDKQVVTGEEESGKADLALDEPCDEQTTKAEDHWFEEADDDEKKVEYPEKPLDEPVDEQTGIVEGQELKETCAGEKEGVESEGPLEKEAVVSEENSNTAEPELEGGSITGKPEAVDTDEPVEQESSNIAKDEKLDENTIDDPETVDTEKPVEQESATPEDEKPDEVTIDEPEAVDTDKRVEQEVEKFDEVAIDEPEVVDTDKPVEEDSATAEDKKLDENVEEAQAETEEKPGEAETQQPWDEEEKECNSGIWLFTDRENIKQFFEPNFLPPYDTPEKRKIIMDVLREEWDENTLSWKPCGQGSMTKIGQEVSATRGTEGQKQIAGDCDALGNACDALNPVYDKLDEIFEGVMSHVHACCAPKPTVKQLGT